MPTKVRERNYKQHAVDDVAQMRHVAPALKQLGIDTLEQFQAMAQVASLELSHYLGTNLDELFAAIPTAASSIPNDAMDVIASAEYSLGVEIDRIPRLMIAPQAELEPPAIADCANLVGRMPPIRDQGSRGTCVAHAALATFECALMGRGAYQDLSEQFLYWNCKRSDGIPSSSGTWIGVAMPLLQRDGCCLEATWPYNPVDVPGNEGQNPPPPGAQMQALGFRTTYRTIASTSVADYRKELINGRAVAFSIPVFNSWYRSSAVAYTGDITMPVPGEVRVGGHAMCIVGCIDMPDAPEIGGGRFILRNSWGLNWGLTCRFGVGYGTIPYAYITKFASEAYSAT